MKRREEDRRGLLWVFDVIVGVRLVDEKKRVWIMEKVNFRS